MEGITSSLFLKNVQVSDTGYYSCKSGDKRAEIWLKVIGSKYFLKKLFQVNV